jgi:replicative DNA helicase
MSSIAVAEKLADTLAASFSGEDDAPFEVEEKIESYDFEDAFQLKIATLALKDNVFAKKTQGLIKPEHFNNVAVASLINLSQQHLARYGQLPTKHSFSQMIKDAIVSGKIRKDLTKEIIDTYKLILKGDLSDRDFVADKVAEFARHQAISQALSKSAEMIFSGKHDLVADLVKKAAAVGVSNADAAYDYFAEIDKRTQERKDMLAGLIPPQGVTTGVKKIDELLYHRGWGKKELSVLLGGAKCGKSSGLLYFATNAALAGKNTLYVTLEMSAKVASARIDSRLSEVEFGLLNESIDEVEKSVKEAQKKAACLYVAEFPTGSLTPMGLRRLIDSYAAEGTRFDIVVVDYLDLMSPDLKTNDAIENSKNIYVGIRAIAQEEDIAMLSATQSNRDGFKSITVKAEHVSEDFNKIRIADLVISINATEDERDRNEMRLYFAASRNQAGNMMVQVKTDAKRMIFIKSVLGVI